MASIDNIKGIQKEKLAIIRQLSNDISSLPPELVIPCIAKANSELAAKNMSFTNQELNLILDQLTSTLPSQTKTKVEILRGMITHGI